MRSFENGHTMYASYAAGSQKASWLGWAVGLFSFWRKRENKARTPSDNGGTLVRVTMWADDPREEVKVLKGARLTRVNGDTVRAFAAEHFAERAGYYRNKGKTLMKLDMEVRFAGGKCELVADRDPYVANIEAVAKADKDHAA